MPTIDSVGTPVNLPEEEKENLKSLIYMANCDPWETPYSFNADDMLKTRRGKVIGVVSLAAVLVIGLSVFYNATALRGTYWAMKGYGYNLTSTDPYDYVEFDSKEILFNKNMTIIKGKYRVRGNTLIMDVGGYEEFNRTSGWLTGSGSIYGGKTIVNGEITYSFRRQGKTIWIDGKEYSKRR